MELHILRLLAWLNPSHRNTRKLRQHKAAHGLIKKPRRKTLADYSLSSSHGLVSVEWERNGRGFAEKATQTTLGL